MNKFYKLINLLLLFSLFVISLGIIFGTYLYVFQDSPPVIMNNLPFQVDKTIYHVGDSIYVTFDYCRYTKVAVTSYVSFVDGLSFIAPPISFAGGKSGCHIMKVELMKVPNLPSGEYTIIGKNEYRINFLSIRYVDWYTTSFRIENPDRQ